MSEVITVANNVSDSAVANVSAISSLNKSGTESSPPNQYHGKS